MSTTNIVAVWDIGKTNAKFCAVDVNGDIVAESSQNFNALPNPPYSHLDIEGIWNWGLEQLSELAKTFNVTQIVVTAHGATCALIDDNDLVLPVLDYEDNSPDEIEEQYAKIRPPFTETYSPALPASLNYGKGIYWIAQKFEKEFAKVKYILNYAQYWSWRLSNVVAGEVSSLGSHSDLWNPVDKQYSSLVSTCGWEKLFVEHRHASDVLGTITKEVQQATGLNKNCEVLCGIHDSNASLVPWLTRPTPFTVASTGTWVINFAVGAELNKLQAERDCVANVTIEGIPVACSRWMGGREYANITHGVTDSPSIEQVQHCIDNELMVLPPQGGQGGPFANGPNDPNGKGNPTVNQELLPAVATLYSALMLNETFDLCSSEGSIIIAGPFAKNKPLLQILAALRPSQTIEISLDPTGTTLGAARLALPNLKPPATETIAALTESTNLENYQNIWKKKVS